jgi:hypothetical protein
MPTMSKAHTPGPWIEQEEVGFVEIHPAHNELFTVAHVKGFDMHEARANARLIAAAPELLEALKAVALWMGKDIEDWPSVQQAIAKAEGLCGS